MKIQKLTALALALARIKSAQPPAGGKKKRNRDQVPKFEFHVVMLVCWGVGRKLGLRNWVLKDWGDWG